VVFTKSKKITIYPATKEDRQYLANLIHFGSYIHRHLDWRPALDWIGRSPFLVARRGSEVVGALACPPDPPRVAWIRLFAVAHGVNPEQIWQEVWSEARLQLLEIAETMKVAVIPLHEWFFRILEDSQFETSHRVVVLSWEPGERPPARIHPSLTLRPMTLDDIPDVERLDMAAFGGVWQNTAACLEIAFLQSAAATIAEQDGEPVGYQISTGSQMGGHLARLAVLPEYHNQGVGYTLVDDLLSLFEKRGAHHVTVNTQHDNLASLALYRKAGFRLTGEEYPVYEWTP
jgi:ribosomal protein S18 acetylase RimI-like enzyme